MSSYFPSFAVGWVLAGCFQYFLFIFGSEQFDPDVLRFSLYLYCLGFAELLESVNFCLSPNMGKLWPLFL